MPTGEFRPEAAGMSGEAPKRILVDLKPALEGYSGIPNESRMLFELLAKTGGVQLTGLIQHGGRKLRSALVPKDQGRSKALQIDAISRSVISLYEDDVHYLYKAVPLRWRNAFSYARFEMRSAFGALHRTSDFAPDHFHGFLWELLFDKTLGHDVRNLILAQRFELLAEPRSWFQRVAIRHRKAALESRGFPRLDTSRHDVFIAQTPFPGTVSPNTQLIVRYHDAVPLFWPHTIRDKATHQSGHFLALQHNVRCGAYFACTSEATRSDLLRIFPEAEPRAAVIHNHPAAAFRPSQEDRSSAIRLLQTLRQRPRRSAAAPAPASPGEFPYLLMVSTFEPRKNHARLLTAWLQLRLTRRPDLRLALVGGKGWSSDDLFRQFQPYLQSEHLFHLEDVPTDMLRVLYSHATATICPSLAEGFDYSGIEAMRCGSPVIASDIPVHREVYGDACVYFDPYSVDELSERIMSATDGAGEAQRKELVAAGFTRAALYNSQQSKAGWVDLLARIAAQRR
jgi:glycosyltransferase involved in cell wall biosynthesis